MSEIRRVNTGDAPRNVYHAGDAPRTVSTFARPARKLFFLVAAVLISIIV